MKTKILIFCVAMLFAGYQSFAQNKLVNTGFESDVSNWAFWFLPNNGWGALSKTTDEAHSGTSSAKMEVFSSSQTDWHVQFNAGGSNIISVQAGRTYQLRFWAKSNSNRADAIKVSVAQPSPYQDINSSITISTTTGWQEYAYAFTPNINYSQARITMLCGKYVEAYFFDDFSLIDITDNLLVNNGFEDNRDKWALSTYGSGSGSYSRTTSQAHLGRASGQVNITATKGTISDAQFFADTDNIIPVHEGKRYEMKFWAKSNSNRTNAFVVGVAQPSPYKNISVPETFSLTTEWQEFTHFFTASESFSHARITILCGKYIETYSLDDFVLRELSDHELRLTAVPFTNSSGTKVNLPFNQELTGPISTNAISVVVNLRFRIVSSTEVSNNTLTLNLQSNVAFGDEVKVQATEQVLSGYHMEVFDIDAVNLVTGTDSSPITAYYVSNAGSDSNSGRISSPFLTIQKAIDKMSESGNNVTTVNVFPGIYREEVVSKESGASGTPIVIRALDGGDVVIAATDPVTGWNHHDGSIYKASFNSSVLQLFALGSLSYDFSSKGNISPTELMVEARFPNIGTTSNGIFETPEDGNYTSMSKSGNNITVANLPTGNYSGAKVYSYANSFGNRWWSHTADIVSNSGNILVGTAKTLTPWLSSHVTGYVSGPLQLLNQEKEWSKDGTYLYFWPKNNENPNNLAIEAKTRGNVLKITHDYVKIEGIKTFGGAIWVSGNHNELINMNMRYVCSNLTWDWSYLGVTAPKINPISGLRFSGNNNQLKDSYLAYAAGEAITLSGDNNTVVNNHIIYTSYYGHFTHSIHLIGDNNKILGNTIRHGGKSHIRVHHGNPAKNYRILYNSISKNGYVAHDIGMVVTWGVHSNGSEIAYNWIHDNLTSSIAGANHGIYLDNNNTDILIHHNAIWNIRGSNIRFNSPQHNIYVYNNTLGYSEENIGDGVFFNPDLGLTDEIVNANFKNNYMNRSISFDSKYPVLLSNNEQNSNFDMLAYPNFWIPSNSPAINQGQNLGPVVFPGGVTFPSVTQNVLDGNPDAGAYEYGGTTWIPGVNRVEDIPIDDNEPSYEVRVSVLGNTISEDNNSDSSYVFSLYDKRDDSQVTTSNLPPFSIVVEFSGTASPADYIFSPGMERNLQPDGTYLLTFTPTSIHQATIVFGAVSDNLLEDDETLIAKVKEIRGTTEIDYAVLPADRRGEVTITSDDELTISFSSQEISQEEGDANAVVALPQLRVSGASTVGYTEDVSVSVRLSEQTLASATFANDLILTGFTPVGLPLSIAIPVTIPEGDYTQAGNQLLPIDANGIQLIGDLLAEGEETFALTLSDFTNASPVTTDSEATGYRTSAYKITDNDKTYQLVFGAVTNGKEEGSVSGSVEVWLVDKDNPGIPVALPVGSNLNVTYSFYTALNSPATGGVDYDNAQSKTITLNPTTGIGAILVSVFDDMASEEPENIGIQLDSFILTPVGGVTIEAITNPLQEEIPIDDNEEPPYEMRIAFFGNNISEENSATLYWFGIYNKRTDSRVTSDSPPFNVELTFSGTASLADYTVDGADLQPDGTYLLNFGSTSFGLQSLRITGVSDNLLEDDETIIMELTRIIGTTRVDNAVLEANRRGEIVITSDDELTISFLSQEISQEEGDVNVAVTLPQLRVSGASTVGYTEDVSVSVRLSEQTPTSAMFANDLSLTGFTPVGLPLSIAISVTIPEGDYTQAGNQLLPIDASGIQLIGDLLVEPEETFALTLSDFTNASPVTTDSEATGYRTSAYKITDNDKTYRLVFGAVTNGKEEGSISGSVEVWLVDKDNPGTAVDLPAGSNLNVMYSFYNPLTSPAIGGVDYDNTQSKIITLAPSTGIGAILVSVFDDMASEEPENIGIQLDSFILTPVGGVTIEAITNPLQEEIPIDDNEEPPYEMRIAFFGNDISEENSATLYWFGIYNKRTDSRVTSDSPPFNVELTFSGTASLADYTVDGADLQPDGTYLLNFGSTSFGLQSLRITGVSDNLLEDDETIIMELTRIIGTTRVDNAVLEANRRGEIVITSDDELTISFLSQEISQEEGDVNVAVTLPQLRVSGASTVGYTEDVSVSVRLSEQTPTSATFANDLSLTGFTPVDLPLSIAIPVMIPQGNYTQAGNQLLPIDASGIQLIGDLLVEPEETFALTLSDFTNASPVTTDSEATGYRTSAYKITDNDKTYRLVFGPVTNGKEEGSISGSVEVWLVDKDNPGTAVDLPAGSNLNVMYSFYNPLTSPAIGGVDYDNTQSKIITLDPSTGIGAILVSVFDDMASEELENIGIQLDSFILTPVGGVTIEAITNPLQEEIPIDDNEESPYEMRLFTLNDNAISEITVESAVNGYISSTYKIEDSDKTYQLVFGPVTNGREEGTASGSVEVWLVDKDNPGTAVALPEGSDLDVTYAFYAPLTSPATGGVGGGVDYDNTRPKVITLDSPTGIGTISVPVFDDTVSEGTENIGVQLENFTLIPVGRMTIEAITNPLQEEIPIDDNEAAYEVRLSTLNDNAISEEGGGEKVYTLGLHDKIDGAEVSTGDVGSFTLNLSFTGTASTSDYSVTGAVDTSGTYSVAFAPVAGDVDSYRRVVSVRGVSDELLEDDETLILELTSVTDFTSVTGATAPTLATLEENRKKEIVIIDSKLRIAFVELVKTQIETNEDQIATLSLLKISGGDASFFTKPITVDVEVVAESPASLIDDLTLSGGIPVPVGDKLIIQITIPPDNYNVAKNIEFVIPDNFKIKGDEVKKPNRVFNFLLKNPQGKAEITTEASMSILNVIDDEGKYEVHIVATETEFKESEVGTMSFTIDLYDNSTGGLPEKITSGGVGFPFSITVDFTGTATQGDDYASPPSKVIEFTADENSKTIFFDVLDDDVVEVPIIETVIIALKESSLNTIVSLSTLNNTVTLNIIDEEKSNIPGISQNQIDAEGIVPGMVSQAISPGDGRVGNECLAIGGLSSDNHVYIYNRWSELIWDIEGYAQDVSDQNNQMLNAFCGKAQGETTILPSGFYFCIVENRLANQEVQMMTSYFDIIGK